jgi:hypothetical protein
MYRDGDQQKRNEKHRQANEIADPSRFRASVIHLR